MSDPVVGHGRSYGEPWKAEELAYAMDEVWRWEHAHLSTVEDLTAERDALRAEVERLTERLDEEVAMHRWSGQEARRLTASLDHVRADRDEAEADATALRAENERLREALRRALDALPQTGMRTVRDIVRAALSKEEVVR